MIYGGQNNQGGNDWKSQWNEYMHSKVKYEQFVMNLKQYIKDKKVRERPFQIPNDATQGDDAHFGMKAKDVLELVLITQYFDTLKDIGEKSTTSTVFVPHNPAALGQMSKEIRGNMGK